MVIWCYNSFNWEGFDVKKFFDKSIDITHNIKMIDWLKSELLTDVADLFKKLVNGVQEDTLDILGEIISNLIIESYLLARRLGISYNTIDLKIENKLKLGMIEEHEIEKRYGDLSELSKHLVSSRSSISNFSQNSKK